MKSKFVLASLFIFLISKNSFSQSFKLGIKGGATINKITGQSFSNQFTYGYQIGAFTTLGLGPKLAIQPEVLLSQISADTSSTFSDVYKFNKLNNIQLKYLSIPVLINYNISRHITLQAGPQFGLLMNKNNSLINNGKNAFKSGDLSMLGGLQLKISHIEIYGRYQIGLNNINDISSSDKWKNQGIQLGVAFVL